MAAPTTVVIRKIAHSFADAVVIFLLANVLSHAVSHFSDGVEGYLLCRRCGHEIAQAAHLLHVPSDLALRQRNDTIAGNNDVLIQLFKNPQDALFEVITSSSANVYTEDKAYAEHSWFPGYTWTISVCPRCGFHIGWKFDLSSTPPKDSKQKSFVGMILDHILHEQEADSIIAVPKAYTS